MNEPVYLSPLEDIDAVSFSPGEEFYYPDTHVCHWCKNPLASALVCHGRPDRRCQRRQFQTRLPAPAAGSHAGTEDAQGQNLCGQL